MHWHPNNDEWLYFIEGEARMTVFASGGTARTFNYQAADVGYVPFAMGHYIQNTGEGSLRFLEMFRSERFAEVSLNQLMALTPAELVEEHLHVDEELMGALHKEKNRSSAKAAWVRRAIRASLRDRRDRDRPAMKSGSTVPPGWGESPPSSSTATSPASKQRPSSARRQWVAL